MGKLKLKSLSMLLMSAVMAVSCLISVSASDDAGVDADRLGSITISLTENSNTADVSDGVLQLYQAAEVKVLNGYMYYDYTDDFYGCTASLDDLEESYYPDELIEWIEDNGIEATASAVPDDGVVVFNTLPLGVYLVTQREASEGYYDILPFVITVPVQEGDTWLYDVSAAPKLEPVSEDGETESDESDHSNTGLEPNYGEETESETDSNSHSSDVQSYDSGSSTGQNNGSDSSTSTSTPSSTSTTTTSTPSSTSTPTNTATSSSSDTAAGTSTSSATDSSSGSGTSSIDISDAIDDSLYKGDAVTPSQVQTGDNTRFIYIGLAAIIIIVLIIFGVRLSRSSKKEKEEEE